jgi:hypothetical protein
MALAHVVHDKLEAAYTRIAAASAFQAWNRLLIALEFREKRCLPISGGWWNGV